MLCDVVNALRPTSPLERALRRFQVFSHLTSHETGKAGYVNTGRPLPYERTALHQLYCRFAVSHYEPAMYLSTLALLTQLLSVSVTHLAAFDGR